jgi:acyl-CoA hydrolase
VHRCTNPAGSAEHRVCDLRGKSTTERALGLIDIAHTDFRDELLRQAKEQDYVS